MTDSRALLLIGWVAPHSLTPGIFCSDVWKVEGSGSHFCFCQFSPDELLLALQLLKAPLLQPIVSFVLHQTH